MLKSIKYYLSSFLIFFCSIVSAQETFRIKEKGIPPIDNFLPEDYDASGQVWGFAKDSSGIMFSAHSGRLLEYDGNKFNKFKNSKATSYRSLFLGPKNRIYYGTNSGFGFLEIDSSYSYNQHPLNPYNDKSIELGRVHEIEMHNNKIFFLSGKRLYILNLNNNKFNILEEPSGFRSISKINGKLIVVIIKKGLFELVNNQLNPLPDNESISKLEINLVAPYSKNEILLFSQIKGIIKYNFKNIIPWDISINKDLIGSRIYSVIDIQNSYTSIGTLSKGIFIIDRKGHLIQKHDKKSGLPSSVVYSQFLDSDNSIWVGTNTGISHVFVNSPFTWLNNKNGIEGSILKVVKHKGYIYVAGYEGIFHKKIKEPWQKPDNSPSFKRLKNFSASAWSFATIGEDLFCATQDGLLQIKGEDFQNIFSKPLSFAQKLDNRSLLVIGNASNSKHYLIRKNINEWKFEKEIKGINQYADFMIVENNESNWLTRTSKGAFYINYGLHYDSIVSIKQYGTSEGLPGETSIRVFPHKKGPLFSTTKGIYKFNKDENTFYKDHDFENTIGDHFVYRFREVPNGDIYVSGGMGKGYLKKINNGKYELTSEPFIKFKTYHDEYIYPVDEKNILIASTKGIIHYDSKIDFKSNDFNSVIRTVHTSTKGDSLLYGGAGKSKNIVLPYSENALKFKYSASFYDESAKTVYSYRLNGFEDSWSEWTSTTEKEYTNLPHGNYSFQLKSKNIYNKIGQTAAYNFTILPPWYLTYYAYTGYLILFISFVWFVVKLNTKRLIKEKQALEIVVEERTEEIRHQKEDIEKKNKKLSELDKVKSRFFANISHELRTPITLINGPIEAMIKGEYGKVSTSLIEGLNVVKNNGKNLAVLVNEILDLTKLEAGKLKLHKNPVHLFSFIQEVIEAYKLQAQKKKINLQFNYTLSEDLSLLIDEGRFKKIVDNLLSNAIKYSDEGSEVILKMEINGSKNIELSVRDSGPGIHPEDLPKIFDRFYQSEQPTAKTQGGTGIGLALAKELAKIHLGSIKAESELGKGSIFKFTFPIEEADSNHIEFNKNEVDVKQLHEIINETIARYSLLFDKEKPLLLIVEDHQEMRAFIKKILNDHFEIIEAENGQIGLELLHKAKVDLMISDVMMPKMDGFELLEKVKEDEKLKNISMIMLTARAAEEDKLFALTLGVDDYLTKPFSAPELLARIKNILENRINKIETANESEEEFISVEEQFVEGLKSLIEKHIDDGILTVSFLSGELALSERQLQRKTKSVTGLTPNQFIREVRLLKAKKILENKAVQTVAEAGYSVGFDTTFYFTTQFSKRFGKNPSEYLG